MTRATRAIRWTAVLAAFVLPGVALGLGVAGWTLYGLVALALLGRYRDMQARIAAGEPDAALFTPDEVQAALDRPVRQGNNHDSFAHVLERRRIVEQAEYDAYLLDRNWQSVLAERNDYSR